MISNQKKINIFLTHRQLVNEKIHYGTFGTFARFYPLFNIKNHYHKHVLIADCDFDKRLGLAAAVFLIPLGQSKVHSIYILCR